MSARVRLVLILTLFLIPLVGCSGKKTRGGELTGTVTLNGKPVTGGNLTLYIGDTGTPVAITPEGTYSATQLPAGEAVAVVDTETLNPKKPKYGGSRGGMGPMPDRGNTAPTGAYVKIPPKYRDKNKSDLKLTVTGEKQEHNFELKE